MIESIYTGTFPYHKRSDKEKNEEYFKKNIEAGVSVSNWGLDNFGTVSVRSSKRNKIINYNLYNNKVSKAEMDKVINPIGLLTDNFPTVYRNYPLLNPAIQRLCGEEKSRYFYPMINICGEGVNRKAKFIDDQFKKFIYSSLLDPNKTEEDIQNDFEAFNKWKLNYRDASEIMAQQTIEYLYQYLHAKNEFSRGFEDLLIVAEEIYITDIISDEPIMYKLNPLDVTTYRGGDSIWINDYDYIIIDGYKSLGNIIDEYHEWLTDSDIEELESLSNTNGSIKNNSGQILNAQIPYNNSENNSIIFPSELDINAYGGWMDSYGNIRVTEVRWRGMRQIGIKTYWDDFGVMRKEYVHESYKPNKELGETVKWEWIEEAYEGTKIGKNKYLKMRVRPVQHRHMDNISKCELGIVGYINNVNVSQARSLFDIGKDWQYTYNAVMYKLLKEISLYKGKMAGLPLHMKPSDMNINQWLYFAEETKYVMLDAFNEGVKGTSQGKIAGGLSGTSSYIEAGDERIIQQLVGIANFIKNEINDITGISAQRKGDIANRETVGAVNAAISNSSLITESFFYNHDLTREKVLTSLLDCAMVAWKNKSFKREYILDDMSLAVLDFNYDIFSSSEYMVVGNNSKEDYELMLIMKQQMGTLIQQGMPLSQFIDIYKTKNISVIKTKLREYEDMLQQRAMEIQKSNQESLNEKLIAEQNIKEAEINLQYEKLDREDMNRQLDRENSITLNEMKLLSVDVNKNNISDVIENRKLSIDESRDMYNKLNKEREIEFKKMMEEKKLKLENDKINAAKELQKMKDESAMKREKLKSETLLKNKVSGEK